MIRTRCAWILTGTLLLSSAFVAAQTAKPAAKIGSTVTLPAPATTGGMPLNEVLQKRRSMRSFATTALTNKEIAQLLWAAQGITDSHGHRTAPSGMGGYFVKVFVASESGIAQFDPKTNTLKTIVDHEVRDSLSDQGTVKAAPVAFIITVDRQRADSSVGGGASRFIYLEAGHAAQNILLEATSMGLAAVPVGGIDPKVVAKGMGDPAGLEPVYLIPVGHIK